MIDNPLLSSLAVAFLPAEWLFLQIFSLSIFFAITVFSLEKSKSIFFVPSFWLGVGWNLIYLIPSIFFGGNILIGLPYYYFVLIMLVICFLPIFLSIWIFLVERLGFDLSPRLSVEGVDNSIILFILFISVIVFFLWSQAIPIYCTGGWALLFDSERALLAREVSGKLSDAHLVWRMMGGYINVFAPLLFLIAGVKLFNLTSSKKWHFVFEGGVLFLLMILVFLSLYINATKGNLIPTMIVLIVATILMPLSFLKKLFFISFSAIFFISGIFYLQNILSKDSSIEKYSLGACVAKFNACERGKELIETASARGYASILGKKSDLPLIASDFETACNLDVNLMSIDNFRGQPDASSGVGDKISGLIDRAFKIPLQVASWYFLWASNFESENFNPIPFLSRFSEKENLAQNIYQKYGVIYSGGDATSTSTAPTTFVFSYSAFFGLYGLILALFLVFLFDVLFIFILKKLNSTLVFGVAGVGVVMAYHFLNTDFFTVIGSHGGIFVVILALALLLRQALNFYNKKFKYN